MWIKAFSTVPGARLVLGHCYFSSTLQVGVVFVLYRALNDKTRILKSYQLPYISSVEGCCHGRSCLPYTTKGHGEKGEDNRGEGAKGN